MNDQYRVFFGFQKEPFSQDLRIEEMMKGPAIIGVKERFVYAVKLGAVAVITGDVGSGKSSALRFASGSLHPSEYRILYVTATSGSIAELYRQICLHPGYRVEEFLKGCTYQSDPSQCYGTGPKEDETCTDNR